MSTYRISQLAERTGVPATTLRFYEQSGLLPAGRTPAGYRVYDETAVDQLAFINSGKMMGLALDEIGELLQVWQSGVCASVRSQLAPLVDQRIVETDRRLAELSAFADRLQSVRVGLTGPAPAGGCGPECGCLINDTPPQSAVVGPVRDLGVTDVSAPNAPSDVEPVIACSLGPDDLSERTEQWRQLLGQAIYRRPLAREGATITLRVGFANHSRVISDVVTLVAAEQQCCSFYGFTVHIGGGEVVVDVRAPQMAEPLMIDLFGALT